MSDFCRVDLEGKVQNAGTIRFLFADVPASRSVPFAVIHYADDGEEQAYGLRLDLDKQVFLDHLDDPKKDDAVRSRVLEIVAAVSAGR